MKLSTTSYVILGALSIQSGLSGYDIRQGIEQSVGYFWGESYGQIYPALKHLAGLGLIEPCREETAKKPAGGRQRQAWAITPAGRDELRAWLALPFHNEPPRNDFMLKLFFSGAAEPGVALRHVEELQRRNHGMLEMLRSIEAVAASQQHPNPNMPYWMLTLALGMAMTEAALEWGRQTMAALAQLDANPSERKEAL